MSNYTPIVNYAAKDALTTGDPAKRILGTELTAELNALATMSQTKEDLSNKNVNNGYAGLDGTARIAKAQSHAQTAFLDEAESVTALWTFTGANGEIRLSGSLPELWWLETDAAANNQKWVIRANGEEFSVRVSDDAESATSPAVAINRTANTVDSIALTSTALTWNGNTLFTTANDGAASGLDADTVDGSHASAFATASHTHAETDITDGSLLARVGSNETISGAWIISGSLTHSGQGRYVRLNGSGNTGGAVTISTSAASGTPADGDIWIQYS